MSILSTFSPEIQSITETIKNEGVSANLGEIESQLAQISSYSQKVILMTSLVFIGILLLWCFFQSLSWKLSVERKIKINKIFKDFKNYFLRFLVLTLVYIFIIYTTLKLNSLIFGINNKLIITLSLLSLGIYFLSISYALLDKYKNYLNPLKYSFVFGIKKIYVLLPIFLLCLIVLSFLIALNIYISSSLFTNILIFTTIILFIVILITEIYRILLTSIIKEY